jgi:hypothetical protein
MDETIRSIYWEAPEHNHIEKTGDWYWVLGIVALAGSVASMIAGNVLFGIVIILAALTMYIASHRKPRMIEFEVSARGIRIEDTLYPYTTLDSYFLDETALINPQLIAKSKKLFMPLLIIPIPAEYITAIEDIEEPFAHKLMEFLGF